MSHAEKDSERQAKVFGKADARYWLQPGKLLLRGRYYTAKIQANGKRSSFPLLTGNKAEAAARAAKRYGDVVALGWEAATLKHKPDEKPAKGALVGDLIQAVKELADVRPPTLARNLAAFRRIVADVLKIDRTAGRFARCGDSREAWLAAVDATPLAKITPDGVERWKLAYVADRGGDDELKARSARISANSLLRMAKSCFSKRLLRFLQDRLQLPAKLPFDGVSFYSRQSMRYKGGVDIAAVIAKATKELAATDREAFKAFLLALFAGLRRNEIDKLRWQSIDFQNCVVRVEERPDFAPKAETSLGEIPIELEVASILQGLRAKEPKAVYVLAGAASKVGAAWNDYRCEETFDKLTAWLREAGLDSRAPLHQLRKEAGSLVCQKAGLFAASRFLRHADVAITSQVYVEHRNAATVGLGAYLSPPTPPGNVVAADFKQAPSAPAKKQRRAKAK